MKEAGISQSQIDKYKSCIFTEEKLQYLAEIKEHHPIISFIDLTSFEAMNVEQLRKSLNWIQEYADGWVRREGLVKKIEEILIEQEKILTNMFHTGLFLKDYLTPEVFQYVDKLHIYFKDANNNNAITTHRTGALSIEGIQDELENIIKITDPLFFADKECLLFEINFFNEEYCSLYFNTRTKDVSVEHTPDQLIQLAKKEKDKEIRLLYEKLQEIKDFENSMSINSRVKEFRQILNDLDSKDSDEMNASILDSYELYNMILSKAKEGPNAVKLFLKDYNSMTYDDYFYLNAEGNIESIDYDLLDTLLSDMSELEDFKSLCTTEHSKKHICRLSDQENASLTHSCLGNAWLNDNDFDLSDYPFDFIKCQRKLDLMNYMSHGNWALRQGFVYKDIAFVQQINGGDEYLTFIKKNDWNWIAFDSVSVEKTIEKNQFYSYFKDIYDRGSDIRNEKSKKVRVGEQRSL